MKYTEAMNNINAKGADDRQEGDLYYTPNALARQLISIIPLKKGQTVLDPAKGYGAFFNNYPEGVKASWCEISEGLCFYKNKESYDWLVTNPPFSNLKKWLIKSCKISRVGFAYVIPSHGLTENRIRACAEFGFNITNLIYFKNPPSWGLGFQMVWVVWQKTKAGNIKTLNHPNTRQTTLGGI